MWNDLPSHLPVEGVLEAVLGVLEHNELLLTLAQQSPDEPEDGEDHRQIVGLARRVGRHRQIVRQLLTLAQDPEAPVRTRPVDLLPIVTRWQQALAATQAPQHRVTLASEVSGELVAMCDPERLDRILGGLFWFTEPQSATVHVRAHHERIFVELVSERPGWSADIAVRGEAPFETRRLAHPTDEHRALALALAHVAAPTLGGVISSTNDADHRLKLSLPLG